MRFSKTLPQLAEDLRVHPNTIRRWVDRQVFVYGTHYVDVRNPDGKLAILRFDPKACENLFLTPPEKR